MGKGERAWKLQMLFARTLVHWAYPRTPAGGSAASDAEDNRRFKKCGCPQPAGQSHVGTTMDGLLSDVRIYNRLLVGSFPVSTVRRPQREEA